MEWRIGRGPMDGFLWATADLLARMPEDHPMRDDVIKNFQMQASGVARYQGKKRFVASAIG